MSNPPRRENNKKRVVDPRDYFEQRSDLTPEQMDEMDRHAEKGHENMAEPTANLLDEKTWGKPPF